jgi:antirestriction protein ArdC
VAHKRQRGDIVQRIATADNFIAATGAEVRLGGNMAYYSIAQLHSDAAHRNVSRCRDLLCHAAALTTH